MTVSLSKSVSIVNASIRENARQARIAGDEAAAAWWDARQAEMQDILQGANRAGLEHLERWAVTRTGHHGARIDGQEPGRYEPAGLIVTSWLQGTSRDGDPQLHIHNQIARMVRTERDGAWRALDTMSVRGQLGAVQAIVSAHAEAELARRFGVEWVARPDGIGNEVKGITREQIEAYSTRTQAIDAETAAAAAGARAEVRPAAQPPRAAVHPAGSHDGHPGRQARGLDRLGCAGRGVGGQVGCAGRHDARAGCAARNRPRRPGGAAAA